MNLDSQCTNNILLFVTSSERLQRGSKELFQLMNEQDRINKLSEVTQHAVIDNRKEIALACPSPGFS